ncbi:MAG: peptide deformylase [Ignavibacteria bacterium]|jgi:peptide deformylase|nr:peptide deformylase [Ignavibacteria bacterium]MCU7502458.1 peptide deformylase [Ignavibacteria bacterium]MCU7514977.1 peptide deformylase [Ignavibacteria bacterium]
MSILPITIYGDRILREKTKPVTDVDIQTIKEIKAMFATMRNANGIGLAANQVGLNKSIFVIDVSPVEGYEKIKPIVMINPKIILTSDDKIQMEEGCLSVPNLRAEVIRPKEIKVKYQDTDMNELTLEADELFARVIQHEYDHLLGVFFTDKISEEQKKQVKKELNRIKSRKIDVDYPIADKD